MQERMKLIELDVTIIVRVHSLEELPDLDFLYIPVTLEKQSPNFAKVQHTISISVVLAELPSLVS